MRDSALAATVPDQLAHVRNHQTDGVVVDGGLEGVDEVDGGARGDGFLADEAVGEDAEVLGGFAEEDDDSFGGGEVGGCEDGDVWGGGGGGEREAEDAEGGAGEAGEDGLADACCGSWLEVWEGVEGGGRGFGGKLFIASRWVSLTRSFLEMKKLNSWSGLAIERI